MKTARIAAGIAATALAVGSWIAATAPASAHDELISSSPGTNSVVATMPDTLTLTYNEDVMTVGDEVALTDGSGNTVTTGEPTIDGAVVSIPVPNASSLADGAYSLAWRVVSADGHPVEGTIVFSVGAVAATQAASESAAEHSHDESGEAEASGDTHESSVTAAAASDSTASSSPNLAWVWVGGAIVVLGAVIAVVIRRRRVDETLGNEKASADEKPASEDDAPGASK